MNLSQNSITPARAAVNDGVERQMEVVDVMDAVSAEEMRSVHPMKRQQAYEELHGVFVGKDSGDATTFQETSELIETSLRLLQLEVNVVPLRRRRAYVRALFLKPSLQTDTDFQLMFLRADRFDVPAAARRLCRFFEEKLRLFGDEKLVCKLTLADLSEEDVTSLLNGAGHVLPHKDRSGRLIFFVDYAYLDYADWKNINRMCWYLALQTLENDVEVQKQGIVEVFFSNGALMKLPRINEHLTKGLVGLLGLPIRYAGIHFCFNNPLFKPVIQLAQMAFGAENRLRFRAHYGTPADFQKELRSFGLVLPMELFERDETFKKSLDELHLSKLRQLESCAVSLVDDCETWTEQTLIVPYPNGLDVLLGKGRSCQEFPGNRTLLGMVEARCSEYHSSTKEQKATIANDVVAEIHRHGGRFLEVVEAVGWRVVTDEIILRNKVTQAFRAQKRNQTSQDACQNDEQSSTSTTSLSTDQSQSDDPGSTKKPRTLL